MSSDIVHTPLPHPQSLSKAFHMLCISSNVCFHRPYSLPQQGQHMLPWRWQDPVDVPFSPPVPFVVGFATRVFRRILWSVNGLVGCWSPWRRRGSRRGLRDPPPPKHWYSLCLLFLQSERLDTRTGGREAVHVLGYADSA